MFKFLRNFSSRIRTLFSSEVNESRLQELEQLFYEADLGVVCSQRLVEKVRHNRRLSTDELLNLIRSELLSLIPRAAPLEMKKPHVILVVGVNGSGKTTSVAKLAFAHKKAGHSVLLAACDTFRAAAGEQLELWAREMGIPLIRSQSGADPAAVAFDALAAAKARACDVVLLDTAGRLQTKTELMQELSKIYRICHKQIGGAPHEVLLVLDATIGQNALDQAALFHQASPLTGIILTKLDGSAKGGIAVALQTETNIPIQWIGTGERKEDFAPFDPVFFVDSLLVEKK
jgi:fused signal recognition particle receptor